MVLETEAEGGGEEAGVLGDERVVGVVSDAIVTVRLNWSLLRVCCGCVRQVACRCGSIFLLCVERAGGVRRDAL